MLGWGVSLFFAGIFFLRSSVFLWVFCTLAFVLGLIVDFNYEVVPK